jgi:hyaluronoglucosaminidase
MRWIAWTRGAALAAACGLAIAAAPGADAAALQHGARTSWAAPTAYVTTFFGNAVTPIDTATNQPEKNISIGLDPGPIAVAPNGKTAWVVSTAYSTGGAGTVTPITTATNTAGQPITVGVDPRSLAITPNGATVYVVNTGNGTSDGTVTPVSTATDTAGKPITVGVDPSGLPTGIVITRTGAPRTS